MRTGTRAGWMLLTVLSLAPCAAAQQVSEKIVGHVHKPERIPATDERVKSLKVANGFRIGKFAEGLGKPRMLAVADDGWVYVTRREEGDVLALRDRDADGVAEERITALQGMEHVHGITIRDNEVYLATIKEVYVCGRGSDGALLTPRKIVDGLPDAGQHPNRTIGFGPDGKLYISVGSTCNACNEGNKENATLLRAEPDGTARKIFAKGLRNTIGFAWHPQTGELWGMDHGIDWLGDDSQKEELNRIIEGGDYGWPIVYEDGKFNPADEPPKGETKESYAARCTSPSLLATAHGSPLALVFYKSGSFGKDYEGDAFVTMRGSWNRKPPSGYEVMRIRFKDGEPKAFERFVSGFLVNGGKEQFGRPCGMALMPDGSLLFGDDDGGVLYRVQRDEKADDVGYPRGVE
jgi:glucose/arabinose dehydrogenase